MDINRIPLEALKGKKAHILRRLSIICGLLNDGDTVLDVGCGVGSYITDALGFLPITVVAIDCDERSISLARHRNAHGNVAYQVASGETFDGGLFDVVVCSHIIEHVVDPARLLGNLRCLLKENGRLFLALPNGYGCFELENSILGAVRSVRWGNWLVERVMASRVKDTMNYDSQHVHFFTFACITGALQNVGFKVLRCYNEQLVGGFITDRVILGTLAAQRLNIKVGDKVPARMANGWIFVCQK